MQKVKMSELELKQKIIVRLAKHWTLIMALVSVFWISMLIDDYYNQVETHEEMKEDKAWLEKQGLDAEFMDEYIDNQGNRVEKTRVQNSILIILHTIGIPIFVYFWLKKFRHQKIIITEDEGRFKFEIIDPPEE